MEFSFIRCQTSVIIFLSLLLATSCGRPNAEKVQESGFENVTTHSQYLKIDRKKDHTVIRIVNPWDSTRLTATYVLVPKESDLPAGLPEGTVVRTPVESLVVYSSVLASAIAELGEEKVIKGVADASYFKSPYIIEGLKNGTIVNIGKPSNPVKEKLISLNPDGVVLNLYEGMDVKGIDNINIPLLKMVDNMEPTPLGRAEWIKFLGALLDKDNEADSIFALVRKSYDDLKQQTSGLDKKPKVLTETIYEGVWYVPGGGSYQAQLIKDASGNYFRGDDKSVGSLNLSFEQVLEKGADADIWLIRVYGEALNRDKLLKKDKRYGYFSPFTTGNVYIADTKETDMFEEFPFHPEKLLHDYAMIFHPEKFEGDSLYYYEKISD